MATAKRTSGQSGRYVSALRLHPKRMLRYVGFVIIIAIVAFVGVLYLWPFRSAQLMHPDKTTNTYGESVTAIEREIAEEKKLSGFRPECTSKLYTHGHQTRESIVMLHGYTSCPAQFDELAKQFYERGYNVYVPRVPHHGFRADSRVYSALTTDSLVAYANNGVARATGLGEQVGVIGLSGGGLLATWLTTARPDAVSRALLIAPFYRPSAKQLPSWQVRPMTFLYGYKLLPDRFTEANFQGFSAYALAQYMRLTDTIDTSAKLPRLKQLALVYSAGDTSIDQSLAEKIPREIMNANPAVSYDSFVLPASWGTGHDIVTPGHPELGNHKDEVYAKYIELYTKDGQR